MGAFATRWVLAVLIAAMAAPAFAADKDKKKKKESDIATADGLTQYKDPKGRFKIKYPSDWQKGSTKDVAVTFADNVGGRVADEIGVSLERAKGVKRDENNLDVIVATIEVEMRKQFTGFTVVQEKTIQVGGFEGRSIVCTGQKDTGVTIEMNMAFTVAGGEFYMVTCATTPQRYPQVSPIFNEVISSFEISAGKKK